MPLQSCCADHTCDENPAVVVMWFHMQRGSEPFTSPFIFCVEGYTNSAPTRHTSGLAAVAPGPPSVIALLMKPPRCTSCVWYLVGGIHGSVTDQVLWLLDTAARCCFVTIHLPASTAVSVLTVSGLGLGLGLARAARVSSVTPNTLLLSSVAQHEEIWLIFDI